MSGFYQDFAEALSHFCMHRSSCSLHLCWVAYIKWLTNPAKSWKVPTFLLHDTVLQAIIVVCLSICHKNVSKWLLGSRQQRHKIAQGFQLSEAKDLGDIRKGSPQKWGANLLMPTVTLSNDVYSTCLTHECL